MCRTDNLTIFVKHRNYLYVIMKKNLLLACSVFLITASATAQTEVTVGVMRGKDYGVTYMLPKTEITITLQLTKHIYTPGQFGRYAGLYLRMDDVRLESEEYWELDRVEVGVTGIPDKDKVYFVKLKDKTSAPLMELTKDGIVRSINVPFSGDEEISQVQQPVIAQHVDPRRFLTEEMLISGSTAKMAELVAKEIYNIRESKNALLRGEADNMPQDGAQLKLMLDNLDMQEKALTGMFTGSTEEIMQSAVIKIVPEEMTDEVAFRFSRRLGLVDKEDLAGEPYYITVTNLHTPNFSTEEDDKGKKKNEGVVYNVPGRAKVVLTSQDGRVLYDAEMPVTQFGGQEYLAPVLFNKNSVIKVWFDTATGGLLKIDREEGN